ncbi:hypothetical protein K2X30_09230 [bacterium]|jgi:mevalonate kinase|nr:hypothetical protein [bacterium]
MSAFECKIPGKWVLTGEHTVLRGGTAIALPHPDFHLKLSFLPGPEGLKIEPAEATLVIQEILDAARPHLAPGFLDSCTGTLKIQSTIPLGAGLGSSAALCVAVTRWLTHLGAKLPENPFEFAKRLEDHFHGKSSGMDIAVTSISKPILFKMDQPPEALGSKNLPRFTFHDTGLRTRTSGCVAKVEAFRSQAPQRGAEIDHLMMQATEQGLDGLRKFAEGQTDAGLQDLAGAMRSGQKCFYDWDLVPKAARELEQKLLKEGALAVKLTGAGGGGFLVALWG